MRLSSWLAVVVVAYCTSAGAATVSLSDVPACGLKCATSIVITSACKSLANTACVCSNQEVTRSISSCVINACTVPEALAMQRFSDVLCDRPRIDNSSSIKVIMPIFTSLAALSFIMRVVALWQNGLRASWRIHDTLIVLAAAALVPFAVAGYMVSWHGLGIDIWWLTTDQISFVLYWYYWAEIAYVWIVGWPRISVMAFYLQIFPGQRFRCITFFLIFCNVGLLIANILVIIFQCDPIPGAWLAWDKLYVAKCIDLHTMVWACSVIVIVLDLITLMLPMPLLWKLNMSTKKKIQVMLMCSVGLFVTIVSTLRLQSLVQFAKSANPTQEYLAITNWSIVESCVGIICACLPAIRTILAKLAPRVFASTDERSGSALSNGRRSDAAGPNCDATKNSRQIRVKTEFITRSRRRDEKSYVELEDIRGGTSGFDHGGLCAIHAGSDSADRIYTTVEVGGGAAAANNSGDSHNRVCSSATLSRSQYDVSDTEQDAQPTGEAHSTAGRRGHAETSVSMV